MCIFKQHFGEHNVSFTFGRDSAVLIAPSRVNSFRHIFIDWKKTTLRIQFNFKEPITFYPWSKTQYFLKYLTLLKLIIEVRPQIEFWTMHVYHLAKLYIMSVTIYLNLSHEFISTEVPFTVSDCYFFLLCLVSFNVNSPLNSMVPIY